jgi:putative transposase
MDDSLQAKAELLAQEIAAQATTAEDFNNIMRTMMASTLQRMLDTEMDVHLGRRGAPAATRAEANVAAEPTTADDPNRLRRRACRPLGPQEVSQPPQRSFEKDGPQRVGQADHRHAPRPRRNLRAAAHRQAPTPRAGLRREDSRTVCYAKGMTARDIQDLVQELYGVEVSPALVSEITADLDAEAAAWRTRPLDAVWPIVYFDGIVVHVRNEQAQVKKHTIYVALGVNLEGRKELLGLWLEETEGAKFWLSCLTDLKNRGLNDIFVACIDGLTGFGDAIRAAYPLTSVQRCIVHLVRAALRYTSEKDSKAVARDLKTIYQAATVEEAERQLDAFAQKWDEKYPTISKTWRSNWSDIITLFDYPPPIRKAIYTTNAIESVNSVIRKYTRNRKIYPNRDSALKLIYLAISEASKKWKMPIRDWKAALNHFAVMFEDRMPELNG